MAHTAAANHNPGCNIPLSLPDCFVEHAAAWHGGSLIDLGVLPGGANSQTVAIGAKGLIAGWSENGLVDPLIGQPEIVAALFEGAKAAKIGARPRGEEGHAPGGKSPGQEGGACHRRTS